MRARSQRCACLVTWFCYQMIAKPGNKTGPPLWPDPYHIEVAQNGWNLGDDVSKWSFLIENICIIQILLLIYFQVMCKHGRLFQFKSCRNRPKVIGNKQWSFLYANERRRYNVILSLIGWAYAYNGSWNKELTRNCFKLHHIPLDRGRPHFQNHIILYSVIIQDYTDALMVTSCNGNAFRVTGPLWGESTAVTVASSYKGPVTQLWSFLWC